MPILTRAPAAVSLFTVVALSVALFAVSDASTAENGRPGGRSFGAPSGAGAPGGPSAPLPDEVSPGEAQYSNEEGYGPFGPPQGVAPQHDAGVDPPAASPYYDFYDGWLARVGNEPEVLEAKDAPSEGSAPGVRAPAGALSVMEPPEPYSQVVDNASPRRFFSGRGWKESPRRAKHYGKDHEYIRPAEGTPPARFEVKIPASGHYAVYARWPAAGGNNPQARFLVETAYGPRKVEVNQRKAGDVWVRLGAYEMEAGDRRSVRVAGRSKAEGRVIADAVMVVRGTQAPPPKERAEGAEDGRADGEAAGVRGAEVVERARTHLGTPYRHSPPLPCQAYSSEDCSCLTRLVFGKWLALPDDPVQQWRVGRSIQRSDLLPGDLVFFKEAGEANPITHVGIYSGDGNIIHSSTYWGGVVERPMKYVGGYYGAKRPN